MAATHPGPGDHRLLVRGLDSGAAGGLLEAVSPPHQFNRSLSVDRLKQEVCRQLLIRQLLIWQLLIRQLLIRQLLIWQILTTSSPSWRC